MYELTIEVAEHRHSGLHDFELGLSFVLEGLERWLEASVSDGE